MRGEFSHVIGLNGTAELSTEFMGTRFDHRIVRNADDRAIGTIQGDRDAGRLLKQSIQRFLKCRRQSIHESASSLARTESPKHRVTAIYHRTVRFSY